MKKEIGIGLSGGGFRATLYNLGVLIRLNELGLLNQLSRITSVSGGSITAAVLAKRWGELVFVEKEGIGLVADNFNAVITRLLWDFCSKKFDNKVIFSGLFSFTQSIADKTARKYNEELFGETTLGDVNSQNVNKPQFLFYGTSLQTRSAIRMVDGLLYDWRIGATDISEWTLGRVVGISSAFPPLLAPVTIDMEHKRWVASKYQQHFDNIKYKKKLMLADGGLYDNMGMESLWKKSSDKLSNNTNPYSKILNDTIDICLISDAGGPTPAVDNPRSNWASVLMRTLDQTIEQARAVRKRWLIDKFISEEVEGAYFGITTNIRDYGVDSLVIDSDITKALKLVPTRLTKFDDITKGELINWGYSLVDAALKRRLPDLYNEKSKATLPFPEYPLN